MCCVGLNGCEGNIVRSPVRSCRRYSRKQQTGAAEYRLRVMVAAVALPAAGAGIRDAAVSAEVQAAAQIKKSAAETIVRAGSSDTNVTAQGPQTWISVYAPWQGYRSTRGAPLSAPQAN
jgi:hypothetical protein